MKTEVNCRGFTKKSPLFLTTSAYFETLIIYYLATVPGGDLYIIWITGLLFHFYDLHLQSSNTL